MKRVATLLLGLGLLVGCDDGGGAGLDSAGAGTSGPGVVGVGQGGGQDFGQFRQILENGEIPAPGTLDALGFFNEHKLDYPAPECGDALCLHALLAVRGNMLDGSDCTMLQLGINTGRTPDRDTALELVIAVDVSGSMQGAPIEYLRRGLELMQQELQPEDRITLVAYSDDAEVRVEGAPAAAPALAEAIAGLRAGGSTNIYGGLSVAFDLAAQRAGEGRDARVLLLSDGRATVGLQEPARMFALADAYAREGVGLTTIGVGRDFDVGLMRGLAEIGAGSFYFLEDPAAVEEVFVEEVRTFLAPLALDVRLEVEGGEGYRLGGVYGVRDWLGGVRRGAAEIPVLFMAGRRLASEPVEGGRRGGGGAIMVELVPLDEEARGVAKITLSWTDPASRERVVQVVEVDRPRSVPEDGFFTDFTVEKGFVMLNLYVGFRLATERFRDGDAPSADAILAALRNGVARWQDRHEDPDPDIADDLRYVDLFRENLRRAASWELDRVSPRPPNPWPAD